MEVCNNRWVIWPHFDKLESVQANEIWVELLPVLYYLSFYLINVLGWNYMCWYVNQRNFLPQINCVKLPIQNSATCNCPHGDIYSRDDLTNWITSIALPVCFGLTYVHSITSIYILYMVYTVHDINTLCNGKYYYGELETLCSSMLNSCMQLYSMVR